MFSKKETINMCLLTFMPKNTNLDYERAKTSAKANPDGFGFAIHAGVAIIKDHDMDFEKLWMRWDDLRKTYKGPAMFHFRIATHGSLNVDNCHPFNIGDNPKNVLGHNGILPLTMPINDNRSDTKLFAEIVLPHIGGVKSLDNPQKLEELGEWASGNKLVILSVDENTESDWYIINEHLGHWKDDIWWSNSSYVRSYPPTYVNYGYPSSTYLGKDYKKNTTYGYVNDDAFDNDWADEKRFNYGTEIEESSYYWTKNDQLDFIEDELYPDVQILNKIRTFTDFSTFNISTVTCHKCSTTYMGDPLEPSCTHCGSCRSCLNCGNSGNCNCWDEYDYGQSYIHYGTLDTQS